MEDANDPIVYRYRPAVIGDGYPGVPPRDLRQSDVDALIGEALLSVTRPAAPPIYIAVDAETTPIDAGEAPIAPEPAETAAFGASEPSAQTPASDAPTDEQPPTPTEATSETAFGVPAEDDQKGSE